MIYKSSSLIPADKCGVWLVKVFHLYRGYNRKVSFIGDFIKCSIKKTRPENWLKKKTKTKGILIRSKKESYKRDGSFVKFFYNNVVLLKKRMTPQGKEIFGPTLYNIKRKKFVSSFVGSI